LSLDALRARLWEDLVSEYHAIREEEKAQHAATSRQREATRQKAHDRLLAFGRRTLKELVLEHVEQEQRSKRPHCHHEDPYEGLPGDCQVWKLKERVEAMEAERKQAEAQEYDPDAWTGG